MLGATLSSIKNVLRTISIQWVQSTSSLLRTKTNERWFLINNFFFDTVLLVAFLPDFHNLLQFYGPHQFHPDTTYDDLRNTSPSSSTTPFVENQSLYWVSKKERECRYVYAMGEHHSNEPYAVPLIYQIASVYFSSYDRLGGSQNLHPCPKNLHKSIL